MDSVTMEERFNSLNVTGVGIVGEDTLVRRRGDTDKGDKEDTSTHPDTLDGGPLPTKEYILI